MRPGGPRLSINGVKLVVYLDRGEIAEFAVEVTSTTTVRNGPRAGLQQTKMTAAIVRLSKIGTTVVEIDPEAEALFLGHGVKR
jgi:hypothetical protein